MKAQLVTRATLAAAAAQRWRGQYPSRGSKYALADGTPSDTIYAALVALGCAPDPDAVDKVIGNTSWTRVDDCDGCGAEVLAVVRVGQEPDYESNTCDLCERCVRDALAVLRKGAK